MISLKIFDQVLANQILIGNEHAFEALINKYKRKVFSYCLNFTNNYHMAEDITQEIFIKVFQNIHTYDSERASLSTWIYTITHNICINSLRDKTNYLELDETINSTNASTEEQIILNEELDIIRQAIAKLPKDEKALILLKDFLGLKYREIAKIGKIPEGTVKSRIHSIRIKIRKMAGEKID